MPRLTVEGRVEVRPAADEQAVDAVEQRGGVVDVPVGGQHDRDRAGLLQRLRVGEPQRQPRRGEVALAAAGGGGPRRRALLPQLVRHHADERRGAMGPAPASRWRIANSIRVPAPVTFAVDQGATKIPPFRGKTATARGGSVTS
jgi:hypothetical protein